MLARANFRGREFYIVPPTITVGVKSISLLPFGPLCLLQATAQITGYDPANAAGLFSSHKAIYAFRLDAAGTALEEINDGSGIFGAATLGVDPATGGFSDIGGTSLDIAVSNPNAAITQHVIIDWSVSITPNSALKTLP